MTSHPDESFMAEMQGLEAAYLESDDPIERSGYGGGPERWELERRPLTEAINRDGSFLDVGCANGWLAKCVVDWVAPRGITIDPYGVDIGAELIRSAKSILRDAWVANAWEWTPPRQFTFVYSLVELAPHGLFADWVMRLARWVEPGGRLIIGSYGSKSRQIEPAMVSEALAGAGYEVAGETIGGDGPITRFGWVQL